MRPFKILYEYFALYSSLTLLGLICLAWSAFALPLYYLLPRRVGTAVEPWRGIMSGFRIYAWSLSVTGTYRLDLRDIDALQGGPPVILAPNHPCLIDALLILTRHPNIVCVMKAALMRNVFLGSGSRLARYVRNESSRQMVKESVAHLRDGGVLLLFPEGTRTTRAPINALVGSVGFDRKKTCPGPGANPGDRDRVALFEQGLAAVPPARAAHHLPGSARQTLRPTLGRPCLHG